MVILKKKGKTKEAAQAKKAGEQLKAVASTLKNQNAQVEAAAKSVMQEEKKASTPEQKKAAAKKVEKVLEKAETVNTKAEKTAEVAKERERRHENVMYKVGQIERYYDDDAKGMGAIQAKVEAKYKPIRTKLIQQYRSWLNVPAPIKNKIENAEKKEIDRECKKHGYRYNRRELRQFRRADSTGGKIDDSDYEGSFDKGYRDAGKIGRRNKNVIHL